LLRFFFSFIELDWEAKAKKHIKSGIRGWEAGRSGKRSKGKIRWEAKNAKEETRNHKENNGFSTIHMVLANMHTVAKSNLVLGSAFMLTYYVLILFYFSESRHKSTGNLRGVDGRSMVPGELQMEVYGPKRSGSKRYKWAKLSWKAADQDECTICLDRFKSGETLVHLPCAHRYHPKCLVPWLENNGQCPCCRMEIHVELS